MTPTLHAGDAASLAKIRVSKGSVGCNEIRTKRRVQRACVGTRAMDKDDIVANKFTV